MYDYDTMIEKYDYSTIFKPTILICNRFIYLFICYICLALTSIGSQTYSAGSDFDINSRWYCVSLL